MMLQKILSLLSKTVSLLTSDKPLFNDAIRRRLLVLAQAIYGLLWLEGSSWKVLVNGKLAFNYDGLSYWARKGSDFPVLGVYKWLTDTLILPNIRLLLPMVFLLEFTIGALFFLGKYVRIAAALAIMQTIAITLSVLNAPNEWKWSYFLMLLVAVIFFVVPTTSKWFNKLSKHK